MYTLNGFDLDDNTLGGYLLFESQPYGGIGRRTNSFDAGQRDGRVSVPWQLDAPVISLVERLPAEHLRAFLAFLNGPELVLSYTDEPMLEASVELLSSQVENLPTADPMVDVRFVLQFNDVFWRSASEHIFEPVALDSASVAVQLFPGLSAPVRDAVVRVRGQVNGLRVSDSRGTFFEYTADLLGTEWLLFDAATGKAFKATTDTWVMNPANEVTSLVTNGPGPYYLELTPSFTDPSSRLAVLTVTSSARSGSPTVEVRGKNAFLV